VHSGVGLGVNGSFPRSSPSFLSDSQLSFLQALYLSASLLLAGSSRTTQWSSLLFLVSLLRTSSPSQPQPSSTTKRSPTTTRRPHQHAPHHPHRTHFPPTDRPSQRPTSPRRVRPPVRPLSPCTPLAATPPAVITPGPRAIPPFAPPSGHGLPSSSTR